MKIVLVFVLFISLTSNVWGLPVVIKATKQTVASNDKYGELGSFDLSKYKTVRIGIALISKRNEDRPIYIKAAGAEDVDVIELGQTTLSDFYNSGSILIESPSNQIKIFSNYTGTYRIYIWAQ